MTRLALVALGSYVAVSLVVSGFGGGPSPSQARPDRVAIGLIQVTAKNTLHTYRSIGRRGRVSDASEQAWSLRDRNGRSIGKLVMICRWVTVRDRFCSGTILMPLGTIAVSGTTATSFYGSWAVVGGTRLYEGADGVADFTAIGRGRMVLVVKLT